MIPEAIYYIGGESHFRRYSKMENEYAPPIGIFAPVPLPQHNIFPSGLSRGL